MESNMLKNLKSKYPNNEYPCNVGQKWTDDEENILLNQLNKNISIDTIAKTHNRTTKAITARCESIVYKLFLNGISMDEIREKTHFNEDKINYIIYTKSFTIEREVYEIQNDIKELKNTMKEILELMKVVHKFEVQ